jgi:ribosomal protein S18 acetylase RimI-like enzyme
MQKYKLLKWDSDFFGISTAIITEDSLDDNELSSILKDLSGQNVQLVYWPSSLDIRSKHAALSNRGLHVDRKVTFVMPSEAVKWHNNDIIILEYSGPMTDKIRSLAIQCGHYSRFNIDTFIPSGAGHRLYIEWLSKSIAKDVADMVFIAKIQDEIVGIITLGNKNGAGDIGLLSIDQSFRGKSIGTQLVYSAQRWFVDNGFKSLQVVTQGNNIGARKLYEKCGYKIGLEQEYYHFWI